jgi:hypothetical protein
MGEMRNAYTIGIDGRIILEWIFGKSVGSCVLDSFDSEQGPVAGSCKYGNEISCCTRAWGGGDFLTSGVTISF